MDELTCEVVLALAVFAQIQCNETMAQMFMSVEEIVQQCIQFHTVPPTVLAR